MLTIEKLNQFHGESHTLWDLSLEVPAGTCTCVMGRNGVGKTTLLQCVMGLLTVTSGSVRFDGKAIDGMKPSERCRLGMGYVPQGRDIFPQMTVEENLRLGLLGRSSQEDSALELVFRIFPVLKTMLKRRGGDLSGGQQQQLAIGRVLAIKPSLLILDEPEEGIQPNIVQHIAEIIERLTGEGMTVLVTSQKLSFVKKVGSQFSILDKGRVVATGAIPKLNDDLVERYLTV